MSNVLVEEGLGTTENAIVYIQHESKNIQRAIIPQIREVTFIKDGAATDTYFYLGLILQMTNGRMKFLGRKDAEAVLNDGVLSRLTIPIEFMRESEDTEDDFRRLHHP